MSERRPNGEVTNLRFHSLILSARRFFQDMTMFCDGTSRLNYVRLRMHNRWIGRTRRAALALRVRAINGRRVYCRPATTDVVVLVDTFKGRYHLPPADQNVRTILDLGSNIGLTIAHYACLYPKARILGVEMDRGNADVCRANITAYGPRCELLIGAAWKVDGEVTYAGDTEWGFRIVPNSGGGLTAVRAFSIPSLIDRLGSTRVDFVKMDIEGAELEVLADAWKWADRVGCLKVEVHPPYTPGACIRDLEAAGMRCELLSDHFGCVLARHPGNRLSPPQEFGN